MDQGTATVRISDSDINFDDVFGGPPTWTRYSYGGSRMKSWEETTISPTGSVERHVFSEMHSSSRTPTSDDVFRRSDKFVQTSSPTPTSMSAKMTKATGIPVFGSNMHTQNNHLSRFSSSIAQTLKNNLGQSTGQTLLSRKSSRVKESPYSTQSTDKDVDHKSKAKTGSSSIEFHFSMHKWANVGVPSLISLHEGTGSSKVSGLSTDNMQDMKHISRTSLLEAVEKEALAMKQEVKSSLIQDDIERKGYEEAGTKRNMETFSGKEKLDAKNRVKVMVKDLFKMSNKESSPKTKTKVSSKWKTRANKRPKKEGTDHIILNLDTNVEMVTDALRTTTLAHDLPAESVKMGPYASVTIPLDSKVPTYDVNMMPDASLMVKEEIKKPNKQKFDQNRTIRKLEDIDFQKDASSASESIPNGSQASVGTTDEPSLDHYWVEELAPIESEAIAALDSKIHMWSSGRTGNIRSLLSTLQLVLWAESGWKPVALVDIIEANALKKSYNRAMLCLHPDKLQQKGIDSHKRYIAEKVLDILQEAWDHW